MKPIDSVEKMSKLQETLVASASNERLPHQLRDASQNLIENLHEMGPAIYHHHYHNAIVGKTDVPFRYNRRRNQQSLDSEEALTNTIGTVKPNSFRRGQGGIFDKSEIPSGYASRMSENYKSQGPTMMDELGMDEKWSMHKSYGRYKKPDLLKLPTERFKQLYAKVVKNHS